MRVSTGIMLLFAATLLIVAQSESDDRLETIRTLFEQGQYEEAKLEADQAIAEEDDGDARVMRGMIKEKMGDKDGAMADYQAASEMPTPDEDDEEEEGEDDSNLKDEYDECKGWSYMCHDEDKKGWMQKHCPKTCHLLENGSLDLHQPGDVQEIPDHIEDKYQECQQWKSVCEVGDRKKWMYANCARTCFEHAECRQSGTCEFGADPSLERDEQHDSLSQFEGDEQEPDHEKDDYANYDAEPHDYQLFQNWQQWSMEFNENQMGEHHQLSWNKATWSKAVANHPWAPKTRPAEKQSLIALYNSAGGSKWGAAVNWMCGDPCQEMWWGVECAYDKATHSLTVTGLDLQANGLKGNFPAEFSLPSLERLDITENPGLKGGLPDSIADSTKLSQFYSTGSLISVTGAVIGQLTELRVLRAGGNLYNGTLDELKDLKKLEELSFKGSWEGMHGTIPASMGGLKKLRTVDLSSCLLRGDIPVEVGELPELVSFQVGETEVTGAVPPGLLRHPKLMVLDLKRNFMGGALTMDKGSATYPLQVLRVSFNHFHSTSEDLNRLTQAFPDLRILDLSNNPLNANIPSFDGLKELVDLVVHSARLFGPVPALTNPKLKKAMLYNNLLSGPIPTALTSGAARELQVLRLHTNRITGKLPTDWSAHIHQLRCLDLHSNMLTGPVPQVLSQGALREVRLDSNKLSGPLPLDSFDWLTSGDREIHTLYLDRNNFDAKLNDELQKKFSGIERFSADGYVRNAEHRTFRICDTRIDIYGEVLSNETLKFIEVKDNSWRLAFDACFSTASKYRHMQWDQKIGEMPQLDSISDKGKFAAQMERYRRAFPKEYAFIPVSFIIPTELAQLKETMANDEKGLAPTTQDGKAYWLLKPRASCCGRGIRLINTFAEVPQDKKGEHSGYIAQRFMSNPYPIVGGQMVKDGKPIGPPGGHKFILRLFVIVTTFNPMSVYVVPDGPMFYTRYPHSLESKLWKDRARFITDYFFTHTQAELGTTFSRLRQNFMAGVNGDDEIEIWRKVKHATVKTLFPLAWRLSQQENQLLPYHRNSYHIFGYDISMNNQQEPVVIEVNAHPMTDLEIVKTNETHKRPVVQQDRELKMDMIDRLGSVLGLYAPPDGSEERAMEAHVRDKAAKFGWEFCDDEPGVVIPRKNGKPCLTPQTFADIVGSELEMSRKGPLECAFPLENGKNVVYLLEGKMPRTDVLVEWWEDTKAHPIGAEHAKQCERKPAYIAPVVTKQYERDQY